MGAIHPTGEQVKSFSTGKDDGPFVMINLLKFKEDPEKGEREYNRYASLVQSMLADVGGRVLWMGDVDSVFIGQQSDMWDRVMLVEYPSRKAFMEMISREDYNRAQLHRETGLEDSVLLVSRELYNGS